MFQCRAYMTRQITFGAEIFDLRASAKLIQRVVADAAAISAGYLSEIENDRVQSPLQLVCTRLLAALRVDKDTRNRLIGLSTSARQMLGARAARSAPGDLGDFVKTILRLGPSLSHRDVARISALLRGLQM